MRIPHTLLSAPALWAIVEEFVTRDGTDHSSVELRIETLMRQLDASRVELHFDRKTETCNILPVEENEPLDPPASSRRPTSQRANPETPTSRTKEKEQ